MKPLVFNFHQILRLEVWSDDERVRDFYLSEYRDHLGQNEQTFQAQVKLFLNSSQHPLPHSTFHHRHKFLAKWQHSILFEEHCIEIHAASNAFAIPIVHHMLVHPALRFLSAQLGTVMLHASAVSLNGKSLIFASKPGTGKTTMVSLLLSDKLRTWQAHADDYVFLTSQPQSLAYLTRLHIYQPVVAWVPILKETLTPWERTKTSFFSILRNISRNQIKYPLRMEIGHAWPESRPCSIAIPAGFVMLRNTTGKSAKCQRIENAPVLLDELVDLNFSEARHFIRLMSESVPEFSTQVRAWKKQESDLLRTIINEIALFEFLLPEENKLHLAGIQQITSLVSGILESPPN